MVEVAVPVASYDFVSYCPNVNCTTLRKFKNTGNDSCTCTTCGTVYAP
jgi:hypothetical protein